VATLTAFAATVTVADTSTESRMTNYPLLITFRGAVFGRGFVADVTATGRLMAAQEDQADWWLYGVNPGAIAAHGASLDDAHQDFRDGLQAVLFQFAAEASSFEAFKTEVERFFYATNEPTAAEWNDAVQLVRANQTRLDGLPIERADEASVVVAVVRKSAETFTPDDNRMRVNAALAKAA
jgi:hypothetical protein